MATKKTHIATYLDGQFVMHTLCGKDIDDGMSLLSVDAILGDDAVPTSNRYCASCCHSAHHILIYVNRTKHDMLSSRAKGES